jgi:hypothetical protein
MPKIYINKIILVSFLIIVVSFFSLQFNNASEDHVIIPASYLDVYISGSFPDIKISIGRLIFTDSTGIFSIYNVPLPYENRNYTLLIGYFHSSSDYGFCPKKLELSRDYVFQNLKEENGRLVFDMGDIILDQIITAKVEGYVKGYDGKPVSNAMVWIIAAPKFNDTISYEYSISSATFTNERGYFVLHPRINCKTDLANFDSWQIIIGVELPFLLFYSNYNLLQTEPEKMENRYIRTELIFNDIDLRKDFKVNITLGKSAVIYGRVIDKDGRPVKNYWLYAGEFFKFEDEYAVGYAVYTNSTTSGTLTDSNGKFVMSTNLKQGVIYLVTGHLDSDVTILIASNRTVLDVGDIFINLKFGYIKYDFSDLYSNISIYDIFPTEFMFYHMNYYETSDAYWNYYNKFHVIELPQVYFMKNIDPYLIPVPAGRVLVTVYPGLVDQYLPGICYIKNYMEEIEYCKKIYHSIWLRRLFWHRITGSVIIKPFPLKSNLEPLSLFNFNTYQFYNSLIQEDSIKSYSRYEENVTMAIEGFKPYRTFVNVTEGQITVIKPLFERIKAPAYFDIKGRILLKIPSEMAITTVTTTSFYTTTEIITTTQTVTRTETETYITISTKTIFHTTTVSSSGTDNLSYFIVIAILLTALLFLMFYRKKRGP